MPLTQPVLNESMNSMNFVLSFHSIKVTSLHNTSSLFVVVVALFYFKTIWCSLPLEVDIVQSGNSSTMKRFPGRGEE